MVTESRKRGEGEWQWKLALLADRVDLHNLQSALTDIFSRKSPNLVFTQSNTCTSYIHHPGWTQGLEKASQKRKGSSSGKIWWFNQVIPDHVSSGHCPGMEVRLVLHRHTNIYHQDHHWKCFWDQQVMAHFKAEEISILPSSPRQEPQPSCPSQEGGWVWRRCFSSGWRVRSENWGMTACAPCFLHRLPPPTSNSFSVPIYSFSPSFQGNALELACSLRSWMISWQTLD